MAVRPRQPRFGGFERRCADARADARRVPARTVRSDGQWHAAGTAIRRALLHLGNRGQEKKRHKRIAETIQHWRTAIAPKLLRQIRQAFVPREVKFRRRLVQRRRAEKRAAEARRRQLSALWTPAPSRSRAHETQDGFVASMHDTVSGTETDDGFPPE